MAKISRVRLDLPSLLGNKYKAQLNYKITFAASEVNEGVTYRHIVRLFGDDTNTSDGIFDDGHDENIRTLLNQVISAQAAPINISLEKGPFSATELDEDLLLGDEIRARVEVKPIGHPEFSPRRAESNLIHLP
jgi:hypothetical protein